MKFTALGIHIALSKYPLGQEKEYLEKQKDVYEQYKKNVLRNLRFQKGVQENKLSKLEGIYEPIVYHLFSHFDVAFLSLINNPKFPQRVFEPHEENKNEIKTVSYQTLTGSVIKSKCSQSPSEILKSNKRFLKIAQIKVNNSILIGNGYSLLDECYNLIEAKLADRGLKNYILVDSYNWAEIILIILDDDPGNLTNCLMEIRNLTLGNIVNNEKIILNSLYNKWGCKNISDANLFSESHSFLSVNYEAFLNTSMNDNFKSLIEWQVKPAHFIPFVKALRDNPFKIDSSLAPVFFKTGKTDFMVLESESNTIELNQKIFKLLRNNENGINDHIRRVKTTPLFPIDETQLSKINSVWKHVFKAPTSSENLLYKYRILESRKVSNWLKKINVSRNIRKKIHKIIYDYNLGIQDPVLFSHFIDLRPLLIRFIDKELEFLSDAIGKVVTTGEQDRSSIKNWNTIFHTRNVEDVIESYIKVFEEAIQDRILNNYNYEDINEFSLDTNSSLSGTVSSLDAIIKFYGECFKKVNSIVTTINDKETLSNRINVNYNTEHISNPSLVFATLIKEISNVTSQLFQTLPNHSDDLIFEDLEGVDFTTNEKIFLSDKDFKYLKADFLKFKFTFFEDTELFIFWHWVYALQNTHLYSTIGHFSEKYFLKELFRLVIVLQACNASNINNLECPIPELRSFWDKHFNRVVRITTKIAASKGFRIKVKEFIDEVHSITVYIHKSSNAEEIPKETLGNYTTAYRGLSDFCKKDANATVDKFQKSFLSDLEGLLSIKEKEFTKNIIKEDDLNNLNDAVKQTWTDTSKSIDVYERIFFKYIAWLSYYSLNQIYGRFGQIRLLRRNFETGEIITHFLSTEHSWYVDPFGGFFINNIDEIEYFMEYVNISTSLIRHLGNVIKKDSF